MSEPSNEPNAALAAVADVIRAAGFTAMAQEFLDKPEVRQRIVRTMTRNIRNDRRLGTKKANDFWRHAAPVVGLRA